MGRSLILYYSETGHTEAIAEALGTLLDAEVERILPANPRARAGPGFGKMLRVLTGRPARARALTNDPASYDVVIVGSPVWAGHVAPVVLGAVREHRAVLRTYASFVTCGGAFAERALRQVSKELGREPVARLVVDDEDRKAGGDAAKIAAFVEALAEASPALAA